MNSKGQNTLPKSIRRELGIDVGGKVAFRLQGETVTMRHSAELEHEDPAIAGFLHLLERDIRAGRCIGDLPEPLLNKMLGALERQVDPDLEIEDDVEF